MKSQIAGALGILLAATGLAADINPLPHGHAAGLTNEYIVARVSLDYPGFEGLAVDNLGKQHFRR
jgi:hypothetical protein